MSSAPRAFSRTLLIDSDVEQGSWLAEQLSHAGFETDLASGWRAADGLLRGRSYNVCIIATALDDPAHLEEVGRLRQRLPGVWLVALSHLQIEKALLHAGAQGVDAVLAEPYSLRDLLSRLTALSVRSRPLF
jgi:DNA-binding response OmpR family regulator